MATDEDNEDLAEVQEPTKLRTRGEDSAVCSTKGLEGSHDIIEVSQWKVYDHGGRPKKLRRRK